MKKRKAYQKWIEDDDTKTGWDSQGWIFEDDEQPVDLDEWETEEICDRDKYGNPIKAIMVRKG